MVAEVTGPGSNVVATLESRISRIEKAVAAPSVTGSQDSGDKVNITDLATKLHELTKSVADVPEVDQPRVDALRQAIAGGNYEIAPQTVAAKLIAFESLLGSSQQK
ncbi:MAG: flagellar biosynthesis anti-sigma factor FlgM [Gammaproteobacteria bacterium]|nr:flagellar biosynthesis anti-sigma factor FlgM [Gammaproteobacteria bacterium]